ncbi:EamA family transporter [Plantactinospora sp. BC1]|uniref:EamA family transporter n=1 Tax=Plantactinospora sp. BC1 TaxID=2108470 RepID=UPI0018FE780D|nr:EamA family transporter [Plantactinospora sp. BC1]
MGTSTGTRTLVTAFAPAVWGTTYVVTTELLPAGHPLFAGLVRSLPAGLVVLAVLRVLPRGVWWWRSLLLGALNIGFFFPLLFVSAERLPGGVAATLGATQPLVVAGLAVGILRESPSWWRIGWGVAGAAGVGFVVLGPQAGLDPVGLLAGLAGALSMALGVTLTKHWRTDEVRPVVFAGWQLTAGGLVLLPLTALFEGRPPAVDLPGLGGYVWLGLVGGLVAYAVWFRGIGTLPVAAVALLGLISPLVAAALGAVVLDQTFGPVQALGFGLALTALAAGQLSAARSGGPGDAPTPPAEAIDVTGSGSRTVPTPPTPGTVPTAGRARTAPGTPGLQEPPRPVRRRAADAPLGQPLPADRHV